LSRSEVREEGVRDGGLVGGEVREEGVRVGGLLGGEVRGGGSEGWWKGMPNLNGLPGPPIPLASCGERDVS
jgi:hypothetical protein